MTDPWDDLDTSDESFPDRIPDWLDAKVDEWKPDTLGGKTPGRGSAGSGAGNPYPGGLSAGVATDTSHDPKVLSHVDERGNARMVDVSAKPDTKRTARAEGFVAMHPDTLSMIVEGRAAKGDVLATARIAGIMGAKQTSALIPMCHPLNITHVAVDLEPVGRGERPDGRCGIHVVAETAVTGKTGIEMEALTATSVACLTVYDMCKAVDRGMEIGEIHLLRKEGGKTGLWTREGFSHE